MAEPLFVNELHAGATSPSASDAFSPASLNVTTVLESPLPNVLTELAERVARLAERDEHAGLSHRPLVWAGVRFGRGLSDQGAAHETLEHGLDVVRDAALQTLEGRVAHKTGSITGILHDAAVVYPANGKPYVLVVLTGNIPDGAVATALIADISRVVYAHHQRD